MTPEEIEALKAALPNDHTRTLLAGGIEALATTNPIRMHSFAHAVREVFSQTLDALAPDADVRDCEWFEQDPTTDTVTRRQRTMFAMQGGLSDEYVRSLDVDPRALHRDLRDAMHRLNNATHVQAVETDPARIAAFADSVLRTLDALLDSVAACRETIREALRSKVYAATIRVFVENTLGEIDLVSSHGYDVDHVYVHPHVTITIGSDEIVVEVEGAAETTLRYGGGDDVTYIPHSWPFRMTLSAPVGDPAEVSMTDVEIDESSWYGDGDGE